MPYHHHFDSDCVCHLCGFDGAEWDHWKKHTYEGKAQPDIKEPICPNSNLDATEYDRPDYEYDPDDYWQL